MTSRAVGKLWELARIAGLLWRVAEAAKIANGTVVRVVETA